MSLCAYGSPAEVPANFFAAYKCVVNPYENRSGRTGRIAFPVKENRLNAPFNRAGIGIRRTGLALNARNVVVSSASALTLCGAADTTRPLSRQAVSFPVGTARSSASTKEAQTLPLTALSDITGARPRREGDVVLCERISALPRHGRMARFRFACGFKRAELRPGRKL
jgi:hypothetical protein